MISELTAGEAICAGEVHYGVVLFLMAVRRRTFAAAVFTFLAVGSIGALRWSRHDTAAPTPADVPVASPADRGSANSSPVTPPPIDPRILARATRWKAYVWAPDEAHLILKPGVRPEAIVPGAQVLEETGNRFTLKMPAVDAPGFRRRAGTLQVRAGVREVCPVFYPSEEIRSRGGGPRLYLTRQLLAILPEGADPEAVASTFGVRLVGRLRFMKDTVLLETQEPLQTLGLAEQLLEARALAAVPQFAMQPRPQGTVRATVNDSLYGQQWHLRNTGQGGGTAGEDLRVEQAWDTTFGAGSVIGILDSGTEHAHPDLAANYLPGSSFDFNDGDLDPAPAGPTESHGTSVSGLAVAVGNNGLGVSGVAPSAKFGALRLITAPISDATIASAMNFQNAVIHVKNNSWSFTEGVLLDTFGHFSDLAAIAGSSVTGRGGKGTVFVFAGMNDGAIGGNVNHSGFCNQRQVISVGSVDFNGFRSPFSNRGAALLVCAPSGGGPGDRALETTDQTGPDGYNTDVSGDYVGTTGGGGFSGTSGSAPLVSGVVALMLSANPDLSARDVQHVLVRSARKNNPGSPSWMTNGAGRLVSHDFGHGVVNAAAAVQLALAFPYAPGERSVEQFDTGVNLAIPDSPSGGTSGGVVSRTLTLPSAGELRVSHVEVVFNATHTWRSDLRVRLSHGGTTSLLAFGTGGDNGDDYPDWQFLSTLHWGESSAGDWTLMVDDLAPADVGTFNSWSIRVYGTLVDATPPVAGTVLDGTGADLAFQSSNDTLSANWSGFSDPEATTLVYEWAIGTFAGGADVRAFSSVGYATSASASGLALTPGTLYFVTVRATNFEGLQTTASSDGVRVTPETTITGSPSNPSVVSDPTFTFAANVGGCTFSYQLDGGPVVPLGAATFVALSGLQAGTHTFTVSATSSGGDTDPTPASFTWLIPIVIVDGTAPLLNPLESQLFVSYFTISPPSGGVGWSVDATPAAVLGSAPFFTGPSSLNYNDGTTYFTGGTNSGSARTPAIDRTALPGTARLKFMCCYQTDTTGTATDSRTVTIWRGDLSGTWTAPIQLHAGASGLGPCAPMGIWHEHTLALDPSWTPDLRVEFSFATVDGLNNTFPGWFIDDVEISDLLVSALSQYVSGSATPLAVGGSTTASTFSLRGIVSGASTGVVLLEVEVQPVGSAFTGTPTATASSLGSGSSIGVQVAVLQTGSYRWRARTVEAISGATSAWMEFGLNPSSAGDFTVTSAPAGGGKGGGGGGCGALGIGALWPVAFAVLFRRRRSVRHHIS